MCVLLVKVTRQCWEVQLGTKASVGEGALSDAHRREALTRIPTPSEGAGPKLSQWARTLEDQIPSSLAACPQLGRGPGQPDGIRLFVPSLGCPWIPRPGSPTTSVLGVALEQAQGCANVETETNIMWALSVHSVFPWCQLGLRRGCPGLLRVEEIVPGSGYSCVTDGSAQGGGSQDAEHLFSWTWLPAPCPI